MEKIAQIDTTCINRIDLSMSATKAERSPNSVFIQIYGMYVYTSGHIDFANQSSQ